MTVERQNPLPIGRYWLDLVGPEKLARFEGAVKGLNEAHPDIIHVINTAHHDATVVPAAPQRDWVLFEITSPAIWDHENIGDPTIAGPDVTAESDTVQRPPEPEDVSTRIADTVEDAEKSLGTIGGTIAKVAVGAGVVVVGGLALYLVFGRRHG
jgi:hypothetical protein